MTTKLTEKPRKSPLPHPARRHLALAPSSSRFAAPPTARFVPVKAVGSFVPTLTKKAFEKFGFSTATLITDWARIAGAELAGYTIPDKLKWPRGGEGVGPDDESERRGATLILRVDPARALDVEYRARQIMDRINSYFGYRAVETIRLVQAPIDTRPLPPPPSCQRHVSDMTRGRTEEGGNPNGQRSGIPPPLPPPHVESKTRLRREGEGIAADNAPLAAALARLEQGVLRRQAPRRT